MAVRLGILSAAHVHAPSYAWCARQLDQVELQGLWDDDVQRGEAFAQRFETKFFTHIEDLLHECDAVVIASENVKHVELAVRAAEFRKHILCEKPLATTVQDGEQMIAAARAGGVVLMTAFPCPFSPAFDRLQARVRSGEIGPLRAICSTNQGTCPMGWFIDPHHSGGGAMMDHTVHVADLLKRLLGHEPVKVHATTNRVMVGGDVEDCAMLTIEYPEGIFATLDASWSKPSSYKTWGNVTMKVVGENGVIELDLFSQSVDHYSSSGKSHRLAGFGSNLDLLMVQEFVAAIEENRSPRVTGEDGLAAVKVALAGYASQAEGQPVNL